MSDRTTNLIRAAALIEQAERILLEASAVDLATDLRQVRSDIERAVSDGE